MSFPSLESNYVLDVFIKKLKLLKAECGLKENHEICVDFQFIDQILFNIGTPHRPPGRIHVDVPLEVLKGMSCLFSLSQSTIENTKVFPLNIKVSVKVVGAACFPPQLPIGTTSIELADKFTALNKGEKVKPLQGIYSIRDADNHEVANLDLIIRVSKLTKVVLSEFTMIGSSSSFVLRGAGQKSSIFTHLFDDSTQQQPENKLKSTEAIEQESNSKT